MIDIPTVFILGAGASKPYNFPSGLELRQAIIRHFVQDIEAVLEYNLSELCGIPRSRLKGQAADFVQQFADSDTLSIDLFLRRNPTHAALGKIAIVTRILTAEHNSCFRETVDPGHNWYTYLFDRMTRNISGSEDFHLFAQNAVTFVTFNFDRSLVHYFFESLCSAFGLVDPPDIAAALGQISILHVYGRIDALPWQDKQGLAYGATGFWRPDIIERLAGNLGLNPDQNRAADVIQTARDRIRTAEKVFFLGFGYAKENLSALAIPEVFTGRQSVCGTAMGYTDNEIKAITNALRPKTEEKPDRAGDTSSPIIANVNCLQALRNWL